MLRFFGVTDISGSVRPTLFRFARRQWCSELRPRARLCARSWRPMFKNYCTWNATLLDRVSVGVVTLIVPVVAVAGTVAVISDAETT